MDRVKIKNTSRNMLVGNMKWKVLACLIINGIILGIPSAIDGAAQGNAVVIAIGTILSIAACIILMPLDVGLAVYSFKVVRQKNGDDLQALFSRFDKFTTIFLAKVITDLQILLGYILLIVPGIIWSIKYSQLDYVLADNPDMSYNEARATAADLMENKKLDYFIFVLSFIGWYLLVLVTFGIALIYVGPYMQIALTNYYEALLDEKGIKKYEDALEKPEDVQQEAEVVDGEVVEEEAVFEEDNKSDEF